jgi:autotransporter-associated beta strand protein
MNTKSLKAFAAAQALIHRSSICPIALMTAAFAIILLGGVTAQAQTEWIATSPDDFSDTAAWDTGIVPNMSSDIAIITNSGVCNYTTDDNYSFNQLWMGVIATSVGDGINTFNMSDGSLTLTDTGSGNIFSIGGNSSATASTVATTNTFAMTGGTLTTSCDTGNNLIGMAAGSYAEVDFNGGTVDFTTNTSTTAGGGLFIGGQGIGVLNVNGADVTVDTANGTAQQGACVIGQGVSTTGKGSGTLNMMSGTLTVLNSSIHIGNKGSNNVLNVTGGIISSKGITFGNGTSSGSVHGTLIMSGGTINLGANNIGQNGAAVVRTMLLSGGTFGNVPGHSWTVTATVSPVLTNNPGPGIVNFAPASSLIIGWPAADSFSGPGGLNVVGPGTLNLAAANTYSGDTTISQGTLALIGSGSIADSTNIIVAGGATFDVSGLSSTFALSSGQVLSNSTSTATINGSVDASLGAISLTYDGPTPSFIIASGTLTLSSGTTFNVDNTGSALAVGSYKIISSTGGAVTVSDSLSSVTVSDGGVADGTIPSLSINGGELYLVVGGPSVSNPAVNGSGNPTFSGQGAPGDTYGVESTTNLITGPWIESGSVTALGDGSWIFTDSSQVNPPTIFYRLYYPDNPGSPPQ